ncbi:hypothetical protein [Sinomicrobium sp. M5D2P9]
MERKAEIDKDLKLRYGYQLVRFAHYNREYSQAISYFKTYVESLDHRPIMYYYALDQKGGAERGLGNYMQAQYDFFRFFTHTRNRKDEAYSSIRICSDLNFEKLLSAAKTTEEKNDLYLLLGYRDFNNPLSAFGKIIANDPNAPQAKVLMARAINHLERSFLPVEYHCSEDNADFWKDRDDPRIPLNVDAATNTFLNQTLNASQGQADNPVVNDKNFWNLTTAWLYFIQKDDKTAKSYLNKVTSPSHSDQKARLETLIDIVSTREITPDFEEKLVDQYGLFDEKHKQRDVYFYLDTRDFITDVLANRYLLQGDDAKAFLLQNNITALEYNPDLQLLEAIENLYDKKEKNILEQQLFANIPPRHYDHETGKTTADTDFDFRVYAAFIRGNTLLRQGNAQKAKAELDKVPDNFSPFATFYNTMTQKEEPLRESWYNGHTNVRSTVFGYNRIECFECYEDLPIGETETVVETDYLEDFPFIKPLMNKRELADAVVQLEKEAGKKGEKSAKANYLLGNFYYNTTTIGYYRHILAFDRTNGNGDKYRNYDYYRKTIPRYPFYFKNYSFRTWFPDNFRLPLGYLDKALLYARDNELKARILFAASKCEQGIFYSTDDDDELNNIDKVDYRERGNKLLEIKTSRYRGYFKELKAYVSK